MAGLGRLRAVEVDRLTLDHGEMPARPDSLYIDCSSYGLPEREPVPVFEADRINGALTVTKIDKAR